MTGWQEFVQTHIDGGATAAAGLGQPCVGCYGDLPEEYRALAGGAALVDRSYRGLIEVYGRDRAAWLHNLTTNDVKTLSPGQGRCAFALNVQGRILFDMNLIVRKESIELHLDRSCLDIARRHFEKYIITEDVHLVDRTHEYVCFGLVGEGAETMLRELGAPDADAMPRLGSSEIALSDCRIPLLRSDFCGPFAVELIVPSDKAVTLWQSFLDRSPSGGAIPVGDDAVQVRRIEAGIPWPGHEITDEYLPAETGQLDRAVSFTKGCYLGQEVVGRMRSHGALARRLVGLEIEGSAIPQAGAAIMAEAGKLVGQLTSACYSLSEERVIGLGYVKTASAVAGVSLHVALENASAGAVVAEPPLIRGTGP